MSEVHKGLEGVIVDETKISFIDGEKGKLYYRGYDVQDLARHSTYEETSYLLLNGELPTNNQLRAYSKKLKKERGLPKKVLKLMKDYEKKDPSLDALRTTVSVLSHYDKERDLETEKANHDKAVRLIAKFPTIIAAHQRIKQGKKPVKPDNNLSHAENFLKMLNGKKPSPLEARAIDLDFLLTSDHTFNASTFSTRLTASTLSDIYSSAVSGVSTLKGPLHGGARSGTMKQMLSIKSEKNVDAFVDKTLREHGKVMGFGHRIYKTFDPRALEFKKMTRELSEEYEDLKWFNLNQRLEKRLLSEPKFKERKLFPNVDFYPPINYLLMGFKPDLGDGMFALGRITGWMSHFIEQRKNNKLIRPKAKYTGSIGKKYLALKDR